MMGSLADHLDESIDRIVKYGIRIIEVNRLREAARVLRSAATAGAFPTDPEALVRLAHAVRDGQEFSEISDVLPTDEQLQPLAEALQNAVSGLLGSSANQAAQFQSELWIGAMLAQSGAQTSVITTGTGRRPDFVIRNGSMLYPVEVKRPAGSLNPQKLVSEAARQLTGPSYHGGGIVVDLTDCLSPAVAVRVEHGPPNPAAVRAECLALTRALNDQVFSPSSGRLRPGRDRVFALITFGRSVHWDLTDLSKMHLSRFLAAVAFYRGSPNNLRGHRARALMRAVSHGVEAVGHHQIKEGGDITQELRCD